MVMLKIRQEQMEIFEEEVRQGIRGKAFADLQRERPREFRQFGEDKIRELMQLAETSIDRYDGDLKTDLRRYILFMFDLGMTFDTDLAWVADVLEDPDIPGESKLDVLEIYAMDRPMSDNSAANPTSDED